MRKGPEDFEEEEFEENNQETETYISELLKDENFDKFLKESKIKFKNNLKFLYKLVNKEKENNEGGAINEVELGDEIEIDESKYFPEEIDELIEERIKDKYFKNIAKFLITSKLNKKKKKKQNFTLNFEDLVITNDDEENCEENEEEDEVKSSSKNKNEFNRNMEKTVKFDKESIYSFFIGIAYYFVDIGLTYFTICLIFIHIFHLETTFFILWVYYALLIILLARVIGNLKFNLIYCVYFYLILRLQFNNH